MHCLTVFAPVLALVLVGTMNLAYAHGCQGHGLYCHAGSMPPGTWWSKTEVASATASIGISMLVAVFVLHYYLHVKKNKIFAAIS